MFDRLTENPQTVAAGIVGLLGCLLVVAGLIFKDSSVKDAGLVIATGAAGYLGLVVRSNAASKQAVQTIKQDIQHVEGEAVKKAEEVAAAVAKEKVAEGQPPRIVNG